MTSLREWGARGSAALAALLFFAILASLLRIEPIPSFVFAGVLLVAPLAAFRPDITLYLLASLVPFAAWIGRQWNGSVAWPEALIVAFCAGYCARRVFVRTNAEDDGLDTPWQIAVALVVAALGVHFLIEAWRFGGAPLRADLWKLLTLEYFISGTSADPVDAAMRLVESLLLFRAAATTARRQTDFAAHLAAWAVTGAAIAAALNVSRMWESALRGDAPWASFVRLFASERFNVHYGDLNAAGSYFVMMLFAAVGLMLRPRGRLWLIAIALIGGSVWITGSRMAVVSGMLAILLPAAARAWRLRRGRLRGTAIVAAALVVALLAAVAAYTIPERGNQRSAMTAAHVRWELVKTSLRMTAANPVFGLGIGRFYSRSGEFSSPELLASFPAAVHENAHNNFLQILAELGIAGLFAVLWLLAAAARYMRVLLARDLRDPLRWSLATGLLAFVISWLGGHPLLVDEPAFVFWTLLGSVAGWGASTIVSAGVETARPVSIRRWIVPAAFALIAISIPIRADRQKADFNLEHRGVGLSTWRDAVDGVRYRLAGPSSSVFLPAEAQSVVVPLRAMPTIADARVELLLDGRQANIVPVPSDRWLLLRLPLPRDRNAPRFRRLDLRVENAAPASQDVLMIGKVEPK